MADNIKPNVISEEVKRPRGRPRKQPLQEINEEGTRLQMTSKQNDVTNKQKPVTLENVQTSLTHFYNTLLGSTNMSQRTAWTGSLFNFNQYNPFLQNQRLKMLNTYPNEMNVEELTKAVSNPAGAEMALRGEGWSLSSSQFLYYKILRLAADIPVFKYYKIPELVDEAVYSKHRFTDEDIYVDDWLKHLDVVNTFKRISLEVKREGKPSYLIRNSVTKELNGEKHVNYVAFQKLPSEYVKLTGIGEHGYIASLNMLLFLNPAFSLDQYPDYIKDIWYALIDCGAIYENPNYGKKKKDNTEKYKVDVSALQNFEYSYINNGATERVKGILSVKQESAGNLGLKAVSYMYWVQLPQDVCFTFCSDSSNAWAIPDTAGLFLGLRELTDYDTLAGLIQSTPLTAVLTAEAEIVNNPNPGQNQTVLSPETIAGFQDKFNSSTSTNLEAFFAPLTNFKLLSLPNVPNSSDITSNATKNFISRAGLAGLIPVTDKPSVAQIKGSQLIEEAACDFVTRQLESVLNFIINELIGCEFKWRVYLWGNIFTYADEVKTTKELFVSGGTFALPKLASAYNMTLRDVKAVQGYINSLDLYSNFQTVTQAQQIKMKSAESGFEVKIEDGKEKQIGAGRPTIDASNIENDNTAASQEGGLDTADMRYAATFNGHCILCGADSDEPLCEECKEKYLEEDYGR